jgi:hypothetical protein
MALVVYHREHREESLVRMLTGEGTTDDAPPPPPETDAWWQQHLIQIHVTPHPSSGREEAHLTFVLEGTRQALGNACRRETSVHKRPLLYFHPKRNWKKHVLEQALRSGFGPEDEGYATRQDRHGRDMWVILRPPFVAEEAIKDSEPQTMRVVFTYIFRNPGQGILKSVLRCSSRFRVLFQAHEREEYCKFEIQPPLADLC